MIITRPDKGNGVVVIDKNVYVKSVEDLFKERSKFRVLKNDPTIYRQGQLKRRLLNLKKKGFLDQSTYVKIYPNGSKPARAYGLPKLHKTYDTTPPFRPIVSSIGTFNYELASFLGGIVKDIIPSEYSCQDSFTFINELKKQNIVGKFMISFDVCSLFTNIPLKETVELAVNLILEKKLDLKIT